MMPLIEMMMKSLDGNGFKQFERQYGLDAKDAEKALEAVLPAFSTGLKRNAAKPRDFGAFMQALSEGRHEKYADDADTAFSDDGVQEGNGILKHLFGSKETSRAVAAQAAESSGVDEQTIKKMLPVIANMVMGGLFKQSANPQQVQASLSGSSTPSHIGGGGILGDILGELVKNQMGGTSRKRTQRRGKKDNPLGDLLEQMMGGQKQSRNRRSDQSFGDDNPLGRIFEDMLSQKQGHYEPESDDHAYEKPRYEERDRHSRRDRDERRDQDYYGEQGDFEDLGPADRYRQPERRHKSRRKDPYLEKNSSGLEDLFGDMFETGRDVDDNYQNGIESIFDKFMKR